MSQDIKKGKAMDKRTFQIGQVFYDKYPPEAAEWCNANGATMVRTDEGYVIAKIPDPTVGELQQFKLTELIDMLSLTDWMTIRENERKIVIPNYNINMKPFIYRDYLRNFNHQDGEWWTMPILTYEQYTEQELPRYDEDAI
jgi:hypothetical protein